MVLKINNNDIENFYKCYPDIANVFFVIDKNFNKIMFKDLDKELKEALNKLNNNEKVKNYIFTTLQLNEVINKNKIIKIKIKNNEIIFKNQNEIEQEEKMFFLQRQELLKKEEIQREREKLNKQRQAELDNAVIEYNGIKLDADEISQGRMSRAYDVLEEKEKQFWVTADDEMVELTKNDFKKALKLAGVNQTAIWTKYAKLKQELYKQKGTEK